MFLLGIFTLIAGVKTGRLLAVNGGLMIISILICARFFDANLPFTLRGLLFIVIGICFLVTNLKLKRKGAVQ